MGKETKLLTHCREVFEKQVPRCHLSWMRLRETRAWDYHGMSWILSFNCHSGGLCQNCDFSAPYSAVASAWQPRSEDFPSKDWGLMLTSWPSSEVVSKTTLTSLEPHCAFALKASEASITCCPPAFPLATPGAAMHRLQSKFFRALPSVLCSVSNTVSFTFF